MGESMIGLIKLALAVLLAPLSGAFVCEALLFLASNVDWRSWVTYGFACYSLVFMVFMVFSPRKIAFIEVLEHEVIHATVALVLFWKDILGLQVDLTKGGITTVDQGDNAIIRLAPYCLPITTIPLIVIRFFVSSSITTAIVDFSIGFTLAFHFLALRWEFKPRQTDFKKTGCLFSAVIVCFVNSTLVVAILCILSGNYSNIRDYFDDSFVRAREFYLIINGILRALSERIA
jgi:hypothetical protein